MLTPSDRPVSAAGSGTASVSPGQAVFVFTARRPGQTTLSFEANVIVGAVAGPADDELVIALGRTVPAKKAEIPVTVIPCKVKVKTIAIFTAQTATLVATMDGEMKSEGDGPFMGSATVNWSRGYTIGARDCSGTIDVASSSTDLRGNVDGNGQLAVELTYLPAVLTHNIMCGGAKTITALVTPDPLILTVPFTGQASTQAQNLREPTFYSMRGSASIVVVPEECAASC